MIRLQLVGNGFIFNLCGSVRDKIHLDDSRIIYQRLKGPETSKGLREVHRPAAHTARAKHHVARTLPIFSP